MAATVKPFARTPETGQPPYLHPDYASTVKRSPKRPPIRLEESLTEVTGPVFAGGWAGPDAADLTRRHPGEPLGERIIVAGPGARRGWPPGAGDAGRIMAMQCRRALPPPGRPARRAARPQFRRRRPGRQRRQRASYRFLTIKPGAYPWRNTPNAWRPAHIHFGVFGPAFATRLVTQMYFPGDPLLAYDAIFHSVRRRGGARAADLRLRPRAQRGGMGARLPLRHRVARPRGDADGAGREMAKLIPTPSQTVGPFFHLALDRPEWGNLDHRQPHRRAHHRRRACARRRRCAGARRLPRTVAGQCRRPLRPPRRRPQRDAARPAISAVSAGSRPMPRARFRFTTIRPGPVPGRGNALQAPHITSPSLPAAC